MKLSTKTAAYATTVIALATSLTACGSEEGKADSATSPGATTGGREAPDAHAAPEPASDASTSDDTKKASADENKDAEAAAAAAPKSGEEPPQGLDQQIQAMEDPAPLQGGKPASDEDREQMERTVFATLNPPSAEKWTRVLVENSCRKVVESFEADMARSGVTLDYIEEASRMQAQAGQGIDVQKTTVSLSDVRVDNSHASASATVTNQNGSQTATQLFEREDGQWKLCN